MVLEGRSRHVPPTTYDDACGVCVVCASRMERGAFCSGGNGIEKAAREGNLRGFVQHQYVNTLGLVEISLIES